MSLNINTFLEQNKVGRVTRRPKHTFHVRHYPFAITPFMIAPVLPGETMKSALLNVRAVTDPIKNPLIGWWLEHYIFYVKHRDLDGRADFEGMMLEIDKDLSAYNQSAAVGMYHAGTGISWVKQCLDRVVDVYFRDEGEDHTDHVVTQGGISTPLAKADGPGWLDSVVIDGSAVSGEGSETASSADTASSLSELQTQWEFLRAMNMTTMDYEDYLRTFGVNVKTEERNEPELIRYSRAWQYPSNAVDYSDGSVSSAVSWAVSERADKDRFFKEPGFIFGVTVARPKVYYNNQTSTATDLMDDAFAWLPAIMRQEPETSLRKLASGAQPFGDGTDGVWLDIRDLLLYGEQFINFALTETDAGLVALPSTDMTNLWYPSLTDIQGLFNGVAYDVSQDGVCQLNILGTQVDQTPSMQGVM